ncbi:MAG TPA: GNAT family N-acetyltransferase [Candidatus Dormibacteraeota bacterium]|jgi:GNAT superfamily N-acetyltransferase
MPRRSTTSPDEAAALKAAGARLVRHAHYLVLELVDSCPADVSLPDGLTLRAGVDAGPSLTRAALAAYPPGHPYAGPFRSWDEAEEELAALLAGGATGPLAPGASATIADASSAVVGAVIVTRLPPQPWGWPGGPWVAEVFVSASWQGRGLGRALLRRAIARCAAAGEERVGLAVTDGSRAERLYRDLGFQRRRTEYVLDV